MNPTNLTAKTPAPPCDVITPHARPTSRWWRMALLAIVPILLVIMCLSLIASKQYYFVDRDPDYAYYIAAYKTVLGRAPGYLHHPGITVIQLTACILRAAHFLSGDHPFAVAGLLDAEWYLHVSVLVYLGINSLMLWLLGLYVHERTRSMGLGIAAQCGTFLILPTLMGSLVKLNAEIVMHGLSLAVAVVTVMTISSCQRKRAWLACLYGVLCGAGVLTKLNFLPVVVLPLIVLKGVWHRILYIVAGVLTAILLIYATPDAWRSFLAQFTAYATRTGVHGKDGVGLLPANAWFVFTRLVLANLPYYVLLACSLVGLLFNSIVRPAQRWGDAARISAAVVLIGAIQTLAVVRTPLSYYLVPAMGLSGLLTGLAPTLVCPLPYYHRIGRLLIMGYALLLFFLGLQYAIRTHRSMQIQFLQWRQDGNTATAISSLLPTNTLHVHDISLQTAVGGLNFGSACSQRNMNDLATNALSHVCFYSVLDGKVWTWDASSDLQKLALFYDEKYFLGYADTGQYGRLNYITPPFPLVSITNIGQYGLYRIETNLFTSAACSQKRAGAGASRYNASGDAKRIVDWIEGWYVNTQIVAYYECTNLLVEIIGDETRWRAARSSLDAFGDYYTAAAAFMDWVKTTDEVTKVESLKQMRKSVNDHTWPFYAYAMANSPSNSAAAFVIMPSELLTRVFNAETLWSPALMWFDAFYERHKGKEGVIEYWETIANKAPSLRGAAATHMMRAALAMGDEERALAIAQQYLTDIRKAEWTVERAVSMLRRMQHPTARAVSVSLEKIEKEP